MHHSRYRWSRRLLIALCATIALACGRHDKDVANAQEVDDTVGSARRLVVVPVPSTPYRVVAIANPGSVAGTVSFAGTPSADTIIQIAADQNGCGKPLSVTRLSRRNNAVAGVVVWLTDIREGRALPTDRRYNLLNNDCRWDPIVQSVATGGTLNVVNQDPLVERASIVDVATGDTAALVPFTDDGQIIPYDKLLKKPGVYELSVESRPSSRAWVVALDHPYVAITKDDGRFSLDGVPPGKYTLRAWHPMLGVTDGTVTVVAGQPATVNLDFKTK